LNMPPSAAGGFLEFLLFLYPPREPGAPALLFLLFPVPYFSRFSCARDDIVDSRGSYSFEHEEREKFLQSAPGTTFFFVTRRKSIRTKSKIRVVELRARE